MKTSNFKLAYFAEASSAAKAGQTSNKVQSPKPQIWYLVFVASLVFEFWFLNFATKESSE